MNRLFIMALFAVAGCNSGPDANTNQGLVATAADDGVPRCAISGSLDDFTATKCSVRAECGPQLYELACNAGTCTCVVDGDESGPLAQGDACANAESATAAIISLCGAPPYSE